MLSWLTWPVDWLARTVSRQRAQELQAALGDARYIDAEQWAALNHIDKEQAQADLDKAVKTGVLQRMYLYEGGDAPGDFLVPQELLDTPVKLVDVGFLGEDDDHTVTASRFRSRPVYVAAEGQAEPATETDQLLHAT
jgi:hypothetical protein